MAEIKPSTPELGNAGIHKILTYTPKVVLMFKLGKKWSKEWGLAKDHEFYEGADLAIEMATALFKKQFINHHRSNERFK